MYKDFLIKNWYHIGALVGLGTFVALFMFWSDLEVLERLLLANFAIMCLHWFEELYWPGGFPYFFNVIRMKSDRPAYFPFNRLSAMVTNYAIGVMYFAAFCFPQILWLGLGAAMFSLLEVLMHCIMGNILTRSFFNSGMITATLGFLPVGVWIVMLDVETGLDAMDWTLAIAYPVIFYMFLAKVVVPLLYDKSGKYAFSEEEVNRFFKVHKHYKRA